MVNDNISYKTESSHLTIYMLNLTNPQVTIST